MTASIAEIVAPELPYLRRFARALTGAQECGDAYVVATLETLIADYRAFDTTLQPRAALYKSFLQVWNAIPINQKAEPIDQSAENVADKRIETLTPKPRQAFLLAALEQFSPSDVAAIMGVQEAEASAFLDIAGKEISAQIAARILIIEDEPLIAMDLESLVTEIGHEVVGVAATRTDAQQLAAITNPGLVLADIQLADGSSGIDAVNDILSRTNVPVIFITAYPERLLTGARAEPTFLITKPFRPEMVKAIISQALFFDLKAARARDAA